jgi:UDP-glucose 4-epimerase
LASSPSLEVYSVLNALGPFELVSLAAQISGEAGGQGQAEVERLFSMNAMGIIRFVAEHLSSIRRIVHASSLEVYGPYMGHDFLEEDPLRAESAYGISKLIGEQGLRILSTAQGLPFVTLRFGSLFGPDEPLGNALCTFLRLAAQGGTLELQGNGSGRRSYIHVEDAARSLLAALSFNQTEVFNIANPELVTVAQLADWAILVQGRGQICFLNPEAQPTHRALATQKMTKLLGFRPNMTTLEGMQRVAGETFIQRPQSKDG